MTVTLNIEKDEKLRNYIKDCIRGQVLSIVREEFLEIIRDELSKKLKGTHTDRFDSFIKSAMVQVVNNICYKELDIDTWKSSFVNPIVEAIVNNAIKGKDWNTLIDSLAKEKVRALIS